jgi:anti-sigma regulatory factor (Ser/Thr protein kinase)
MYVHEFTEPRLRCVLPFAAAPAEVRLLRRTVAGQLSRWGMPVAAGEVELLVTELATNVIKHVGEGTSSTLILEWQEQRLRLEVHDQSHVLPSVKTADCDEECGRGLHLLAALSADWGTALTIAGKAVWCEVPVSAGRPCQRIGRAAEALENYQTARGSAFVDRRGRALGLEQAAVELIADLLHWTAARGHDPDDILDRAQMHYEADADPDAA